jgi:hypothetical protein
VRLQLDSSTLSINRFCDGSGQQHFEFRRVGPKLLLCVGGGRARPRALRVAMNYTFRVFTGFILLCALLGLHAAQGNRNLGEWTHTIDHPHIHLGKLAAAINATIDPVVDASLNDLFRVYHPGNVCPFKRKVMSKLATGEKIKILIVGGSVTYGADLQDRMGQRWSTYFTQLLNSGWYSGGLEIVNIGVGACNVDVWMYKVSQMSDADLVIVDLTVNDQGFDLQALPHLYRTFVQLIDDQPNHPALLFHQAFRTANHDYNDINKHCPEEHSHGTCCNGFYFCKRWWDMQDFVGIALNRLGVPFMSYRDLIWPSYENPPSTLDIWWNGMSHPDYKAHRMIAKLLAFGFMMQVKDAHGATHCTSEGDNSRYVTLQASVSVS